MTTKLPGIPTLPAGISPDLKAYLKALSETVEVRTGVRGDPKDRAVTLRELEDSGLAESLKANPFDPNNITARNRGFRATIVRDRSVPPAPTSLTASGGFTKVILEWNNPNIAYGNHAFTEIYRLSTDTIGDAVLVGITPSFIFTDEVDSNTTYYYWIRFVSETGVPGPFNQTSGTSATTTQLVTADLADDIITAAKINDGAVGTLALAADAVTNAKLAVNSIQGDVIAANAITATKILDGSIETAKLDANAVTAEKIAANTITASEIAADTITADQMVADTITAASGILADAVITNAKIADGTIQTAKIGDGQILNAKIADAAINNAKIADSTIQSAKIADAAITNAKIGNAAITNAKIQDATIQGGKIAVNTINGNRVTADTLVLYDKADFGTMGSIQLHTSGTDDPTQQTLAYTDFTASAPRQQHSTADKYPTVTTLPLVFSRTYNFNMRSASSRSFLFDVMVEPFGNYSSSSQMGYVITLDTSSSNSASGNMYNAYTNGPFTGSLAGSKIRRRNIISLTSSTNYYLKVFFYSKSISDNPQGDRGVNVTVSVEGLFV